MGTKDTRKAHKAAGKTDMLLFDPEDLVLVVDEKSDLYDERVHLEPAEPFVLNLEHYGVLEPVIVRKNTTSGRTEVVDGRQRVKGLREANKRLKKRGEEPWRVAAVVKRGDAGQAIGMMISTNEQRCADSPLNLARKAARMLERGKTEIEVGVALGRSPSSVKNLIALLDAPACVRHAVESEKITTSDGYKLAKLAPDEAAKMVAKLIAEAPRTPGKKRSRNASKAREIVDGGKSKSKAKREARETPTAADGVRAVNQMENVQRDLEALGDGPGPTPHSAHLVRGALCVLRWYFGDSDALKELGI